MRNINAPSIVKGSEKYASYRKILYQKKSGAVEQILWQEPDGKVYLQVIYSNFAQSRSRILPCSNIGNGKYKCENITVDTKENKTYARISFEDAIKESPVLNSAAGFLKETALKTIVIGIITGLAVYTITRLIDNTLQGVRA